MSTTALLAATAASNASGAGSPVSALCMGLTLIAIAFWATHLFSDEGQKGDDGKATATIFLLIFVLVCTIGIMIFGGSK